MPAKNDGSTVNGLPSDRDLASLADLLNEEIPDENADQNIAEFLAKLDGADSIARHMEDNLDQILQRLDGMLEGIEASQVAERANKVDESNEDGSDSQAKLQENNPSS